MRAVPSNSQAKYANYMGRESVLSVFSYHVGMNHINDTQKSNGLFTVVEHMTDRGEKKENSCLSMAYTRLL